MVLDLIEPPDDQVKEGGLKEKVHGLGIGLAAEIKQFRADR
jgi:hypothetical protein